MIRGLESIKLILESEDPNSLSYSSCIIQRLEQQKESLFSCYNRKKDFVFFFKNQREALIHCCEKLEKSVKICPLV